MVCKEIAQFKHNCDPNKIVIGLDHGKKKIGIAFSALNNKIALPHGIYYRRSLKKDLDYIKDLVVRKKASGLVIGITNTGDEWCSEIEGFAHKISKTIGLVVLLEDETFSTKIALEKLSTLKKHQIKRAEDTVAAATILQQVLDKMQD